MRKSSSTLTHIRKSVTDTFFDVFSKTIVPSAVLLGQHPNFCSLDELNAFCEQLSEQLEQALYREFFNKKSGSTITRAAKDEDSGDSQKYRSLFRDMTTLFTDQQNTQLHLQIMKGELEPKEFVKKAAAMVTPASELDGSREDALREMAEAVRAESFSVAKDATNNTIENGSGNGNRDLNELILSKSKPLRNIKRQIEPPPLIVVDLAPTGMSTVSSDLTAPTNVLTEVNAANDCTIVASEYNDPLPATDVSNDACPAFPTEDRKSVV